MDRASLMRSLQPVYVLQHFQPEEVAPYAEVIHQSCGWMDASRFDLVCKALVAEIKTNVRLKPAHFIVKYKELAARNGWDKQSDSRCTACAGQHFVYVWVRDEQGREYRAMKGCARCNEGMSNLKPGLVEIPEPAERRPKIADLKLRPSHAKILWRIAENAGFDLPDELWEKIGHFAALPEPIESIERGQLTMADEAERRRKAEELAAKLRAAYAGVRTPGEASDDPEPPQAAPEPAASVRTPPIHTPTKVASPIRKISAEEAAQTDMPF